MGAATQGVEQGGRGFLYLGVNLRGVGSGGSVLWVRDVGDDTAHWDSYGQIPPQGGPQADGTTTLERKGRWVGVFPAGGSDDACRVTEGGVLRLLTPEHIITVYYDQYHYGLVSSGGEVSVFTGGKAFVGTGQLGHERDVDGGS